MLVVKVKDEGIGISANEIEHIFTRFYSNKKNRRIESNGIGLSLTKDLVNMHHGTIVVESVLGQGSCFTVKLPIDKEEYTSDELLNETMVLQADMDEIVVDDYVSIGDMDQFTILLIDDNIELLSVMKEMFKERYRVLTAVDGRTAYDKLNNNEVNVIICDVMLPDINGWELCTRIKGDLRFNHIPVIILTARNGVDDRIASYEAGADGYIAKPFELKILFARVDNLVRASKMRQITFRKEEKLNLESLAYPSADKQFLQSIIDSIERHLEDVEYDLEQLSVEVHMSKSTLYRKIKSMTGMTPLDFVRNIKMKHACMMLLNRTQNISEIAYAIGFTSPKYFSKCFKEEFGVTPSEYLQKHDGVHG
jgi:DNA-binding response OmpR family regulator